MRKVILYIAMSLDGYIADSSGNVDWLRGQDDDVETADSFPEFEKSIDTVVMGWKTYHQIATELSPDKWVYDNLKSYVCTHRHCVSTESITFSQSDPCSLVKCLRKEEGRDIWICGGASIVRQLMEENLIDVYHIAVIPIILGSGIRLFPESGSEIRLKLVSVNSSNGIRELIYQRK